LPVDTASASGLPAAQTRVWAITPTVTTVVGVAKHIAAGQRRSRAPSQLRLVSGHCVTAETGTGAGRAALDTNVLIRDLDNGELNSVDKALARRVPSVSQKAADEYLAGGSQDSLDQFLADREGSIGPAGTQEGAAALRSQATALDRALGLNDALVADSAMQEGIPLITCDHRLLRFLGEIGYPGELF
jgi:predicted nucleic acid-binding protein